MVSDTASQPSGLGATIVRGTLMAALITIAWGALFVVMDVTAYSATLAVVVAGGFRLLCFGVPMKKLK